MTFVAGQQIRLRHGHARAGKATRTYHCWTGIIKRCYNPAATYYSEYGGRGISVCERWRKFENFLADMGECPLGPTEFSIDRVDNDGNYEPSNCRWATAAEQTRNKRSNRYFEHNGERMCIADWERRLGIPRAALNNRLRRGWSFEEAISPTFSRRKGYKICRRSK